MAFLLSEILLRWRARQASVKNAFAQSVEILLVDGGGLRRIRARQK